MKKIASLILGLSPIVLSAQFYQSYDWADKPVKTVMTPDEKKEASVGILESITTEVIEGSNYLQQFETHHSITHVNNEEGIQRHNRVYIPMYGVMDIVDIKARTINKAGKVTLLDKSNIKEVQNVDEYGDFKIFAIEGVEIDSDIEVLYTLEKDYFPFGSENLQDEYPIREASFTLIFGKSLGRLKAYRTDSPVEKVEVNGNKALRLKLKNIPAMLEEEYSTPRANLISVAYQCFHSQNDLTDAMLWKNVAMNFSADFFPRSPARQVITEMENVIPKGSTMTDFQKVAKLDDYIKTNFTLVQNNNPQLKDMAYIMKNRSTNESGMMQVYGHYLRAMGINYQVVITANRYLLKFDPEFFNPRSIQNFLIYIPSMKQYLSPDRIEYRIGEAPFNILGNKAVFINPDFSFTYGKIDQMDPNYSRIVRSTEVTFDEDMENTIITQNHAYYGHWAVNNRAVYQLSPEAGRKEFEDYLTASGIEDKVSLDFKLENELMFQEKPDVPFNVYSKIESGSLLEEAGDSYIFQAGLVIGTQSELYQERKRVNPIEMQYPNKYNYTITISIPEGYTAQGMESLKINKRLEGPSGLQCKFESNYKLEGNKIVIMIEEEYRQFEYAIADYDAFREVINAASDFNKASILFKPKK
jgi:hypothetical protein